MRCTRVLFACLFATAALSGCPAGTDDAPPPRSVVAPRATHQQPARPIDSEPAEQQQVEESERGGILTREELLGIQPSDVFAKGLTGRGPHGLARGLAGTGALALCEQVRREGTPKEALALSSVIFRRAAEQVFPKQRATEAIHAELVRNIDVQAGDQRCLQTWLLNLEEACDFHEDLLAAAAFLGQAHLMWDSVEATERLGGKDR